MAKGVRLGGPRGVAWAVGRSGGRASYPCSRKRGRKTGVRRAGAGLSGKATGEVTRGRRRGHSGLFLPLRAPGRADPAAPGASASARRRRGKPSLWA